MYGRRFARIGRASGLSKRFPNEVYEIVHLTPNESRLATHRALVRVGGSQVQRKRWLRLIPTHHDNDQEGSEPLNDDALFCRWKHIFITATAKIVRPLSAFILPACEIVEASFEPLQKADCGDDPSTNHRVRFAFDI